jgi:hypothetical protein
LQFFLFASRSAGGQRGTSEQFAAAFAVLGRMLGLPTRVVVGFEATAPTSVVRGADALAWPEVLFNDVGWVPFNPFPTTGQPPRHVEDDFAASAMPPSPPPTTVPAPSDSPSAHPSPSPLAGPASRTPSSGRWPMRAALAAASILAALAVAALAAEQRRRRELRRWTHGPREARVVHAWWAVHRSLRKAGKRPPPHLDASEVAAHAARFAEPPLNDLVIAVNAVTFGGQVLSEVQVEAAQAQARAYLSALRSRA